MTRSSEHGLLQERFPNSSMKSVGCGLSMEKVGLMRQVSWPLKLMPLRNPTMPKLNCDVQTNAVMLPNRSRLGLVSNYYSATRLSSFKRPKWMNSKPKLRKPVELLAEMKAELSDARLEIRHARDREAAAVVKAQTAADDRRSFQDQLVAAQEPPPIQVPDHNDDIAAAADTARRLAEQLETLLVSPSENDAEAALPKRRSARTPLSLPGGVIASSGEAAEFLARSDAQLIIDGYNVAKLGWPNLPLEEQRNVLLDVVENLALRFGTNVTVIFDGASVVGAHASRRRLTRVVYSPSGIIADDVIRDEVRRIPANNAVVVVTNDAQIVRDVRRDGANVVPSNAFLSIL